MKRDELGDFETLFQELKEDPDMFFRYTRMTVQVFMVLLELLKPYLTKMSNRKPLSPEQRLAITLRYLATGDQVLSVALAYRVGESTANGVIQETCEIIMQVLGPIYLCRPDEIQWEMISRGFFEEWNLPNCLGAIDGKHIQIQTPPNSGSLFFNYKKTFSVVLMAACDHTYKFTFVEVGAYGSESDGGIFSRSDLGKALENGTLNIPKGTRQLPDSNVRTSHYFAGDEAFKMSKNIMRPYPGRYLDIPKRIFYYRLSRGRRTIENTFGILASRWRVLRKPICKTPDKVNMIVMPIVCLHNFMMTENEKQSLANERYCPPQIIDRENVDRTIIEGDWRQDDNGGFESTGRVSAHRATVEAYDQRTVLTAYFMSPEGQVPWQDEYIHRGENRDDVA